MSLTYKYLEQNITSTIYEGLLKIGYNNKESFSIYYDLDLLNHLLNTKFTNNQECLKCLLHMNEALHIISQITITLDKSRFKFTVSHNDILTINTYYDKDNYLKELIDLVRTHNFTLEDVTNIFDNSGHAYHLEESTNEEFQYVFYFYDSEVDPYYYCFTFDQMGGYYHRLLEYDYKKL